MDSGRKKTITRKYYSDLWYVKDTKGFVVVVFLETEEQSNTYSKNVEEDNERETPKAFLL